MTGHEHEPTGASSSSRIGTAFLLNFAFTLVELVGGILSGSVAILADAIHDLGDTLSLGVAYGFERLARRRPDRRFSYGYRRVSALSALFTGFVLLVGSGIIVTKAIHRFAEPREPHGYAMLGLAIFGVVVNGIAARTLAHGRTENERMLTWHLLEDVIGWAAVLVGSILLLVFDWTWIDPALAIAVALFILWNVARNLVGTVRLFLQEVPADLDLDDLREEIEQIDGIEGVHDLHAWSLDGEHHVLSCHIVVPEGGSAEEVKRAVRERVSAHGAFHVTIEVETPSEACHEDCDP